MEEVQLPHLLTSPLLPPSMALVGGRHLPILAPPRIARTSASPTAARASPRRVASKTYRPVARSTKKSSVETTAAPPRAAAMTAATVLLPAPDTPRRTTSAGVGQRMIGGSHAVAHAVASSGAACDMRARRVAKHGGLDGLKAVRAASRAAATLLSQPRALRLSLSRYARRSGTIRERANALLPATRRAALDLRGC